MGLTSVELDVLGGQALILSVEISASSDILMATLTTSSTLIALCGSVK